MSRLVAPGRYLFAIALIGLGAEHFVFEQFVTGRAPAWPAGVAGARAWAWITGAVFITAGTCLLIGRLVRYAAWLAALLIFGWALLRHVPIVIVDPLLAPSWTQAGKALVLFSGVLAVAATTPPANAWRFVWLQRIVNQSTASITLARVCLALFMVVAGMQHFIYTDFVASLIPAWIPGDAGAWSYFAAVALIAGGVGMNVPLTTRWAALLSGLMVFSWFWIVHLPRTLVSVSDGIALFEALAVAGIALLLAGTRHARTPDTSLLTSPSIRVTTS